MAEILARGSLAREFVPKNLRYVPTLLRGGDDFRAKRASD